jgi:small subunit ribosomal protein S6
MKKYEAVLILNPNLSSKVEDFKEEFNKLLIDNSFKITKLEDVGRRQLAYSINNHNKGHYLLMNLEGDPSKLLEIETKIKYNESIIRHLVLAVKNHSEDESVLMAESKNKKSEASETKKEAVQKVADDKEKNDE